MLKPVVTAVALALTAAPVLGQGARPPVSVPMPAEQVDRIWQALDLTEALDIMRQEGRALSDEIARDYLAGRDGGGWDEAVERIYDPEAMDQTMRTAFAEDLSGADAAPILAFFESDLGHRIISYEMRARRSFLDRQVEDAARDLVLSGDVPEDRAALIDRFIDANDLVDFNTSGAMNTNFAFLTGLSRSDSFAMTEAEVLDQVWTESESSGADTELWLQAYLTTAYEPLSDDDLQSYLDFSRTEQGQRLNRALFAGFGEMYEQQYHALGLAVAQQMAGQDL
jgi:hypothetical protein